MGCYADDDQAILETARRMNWSVDTVKQHYLTGCESGRPSEMAVCGAYHFVQADLKLNEVYSRVLFELGTKTAQSKLVSSQRTWKTFVDNTCSFETDGYKKSRDLSAVAFSCRATYTNERIKHLEEFLDCDRKYGCPGVE